MIEERKQKMWQKITLINVALHFLMIEYGSLAHGGLFSKMSLYCRLNRFFCHLVL